MAKKSKATEISHNGARQYEIMDDSLLPDVREVERFAVLDPNILEWLKTRAEKEQDFRHSDRKKQLNILTNDQRGNRIVNYLGISFAFILVLVAMYISYQLIISNHETLGGIFGGSIILAVVGAFLNKVKNKK